MGEKKIENLLIRVDKQFKYRSNESSLSSSGSEMNIDLLDLLYDVSLALLKQHKSNKKLHENIEQVNEISANLFSSDMKIQKTMKKLGNGFLEGVNNKEETGIKTF